MSTNLPRGWCRAKVRDVGSVQLGRQRSPDVHIGSNMRPYLRVANVYEDRIDLADVMQMHFEPHEVERYELKVGDILLNEGQSRELVGRPAMYRGELPGACFTNSLVRFQAGEAVVREFALAQFLHWLKSGAFIPNAQITTNIAHLGAGRFAEMEFALPPLNEQRRIVAKLESLQARSRRAREALDAVPPLLEKLRQSILAAAFRGDLTKDWRAKHPNPEPATELLKRIRTERRRRWEEAELARLTTKGTSPRDERWKAKYQEPAPIDDANLPELPESWCWTNLDELSWDSGYGTSSKCDYDGRGAAVLRIPNIAQGRVDLTDMKRELEPSDSSRLLLAPGDLLIVRTNGSRDLIGRGSVVTLDFQEPTSFASYLIRFRLVAAEAAHFWVSEYWQSPAVRSQIDAHAASSAGQYNVSLRELASTPIPLAPMSEQNVILRRLQPMRERIAQLQLELDTLIRQQVSLEQTLLAKAFRGELVPQDPSDEPADTLLARLRADEPSPTLAKSKPRGRRTKAAE